MERTPRPPGRVPERYGQEQSAQPAAESRPAPAAESWDERVIHHGIQTAVAEERPIDNRTARYIASQFHGGQASALYALASSGAITDEVMGELVHETPAQAWIDALIAYCASRSDPGPVAGWVERAEAQDRGDLFAAIESASVTRLGDVATVYAPEPPSDEEDDDGRDHFSWGDAARWSPAVQVESAAEETPNFSDEQLDALFGDGADEEIGDVQDLGWYGLARWTDQPGGLILKCDD